MTKKLTFDILRKFPKAELHCHLDGAARVSTVIELAKQQGVKLPTFDEAELSKIVCVDDNCESLVQYLRGFDIILSVMQVQYAIERIMFECAEDAAKDGVKYLEVRFSPILHTKNGLPLSSILSAVIRGKNRAELELGIVVRIVVCAMRHMESSVTQKLAELAWRYRHRGVVAFDLAGPEDGFSSKCHKEAFELIHTRMFNTTLHSGEAASWQSVQDSVRFCGAQRIGHGVRMREDPDLVKFIANEGIPIEVCITSNVQTKCIKDIYDHPIRDFFDAGVVVCPCTDNPTISNVTLSMELLKIQDIYNFSIPEIIQLIDMGFRSAFISEAQKRALRYYAMTKIRQVLREEGYDTSDIFNSYHFRISFPEFFEEPFNIHSEIPQEKLLEVLQKMPKLDLNCKLVGSVSIDTMWGHFEQLKDDPMLLIEFDILQSQMPRTKEQFVEFVHGHNGIGANIFKVLNLIAHLMQTQEQIEIGMDDVYSNAAKDNCIYLELNIRPSLHSRRNLSPEQVLNIVLNKKPELEKKYNIRSNITLYVDMTEDGSEQIRQAVALAIQYKEKISAFALCQTCDTLEPIPTVQESIVALKNNNIPICMECAFKNPKSFLPAITKFGATRLSGCFSIHREPHMVEYIANHRIPMEVGMTKTLQKYTTDINFTASFVRYMFDCGVQLAPSSFDMSLYPTTRAGIIADMVRDCHFSLVELQTVLLTSCKTNFGDNKLRKDLFHQAFAMMQQVQQELRQK